MLLAAIGGPLAATSTQAQIDTQATFATSTLYGNLMGLKDTRLFFGHHFTDFEGRGWTDPDATQNRSDVQAATGSFPAMYGYDFVRGFSAFNAHAKKAYARGGILTVSWHADNPVTGGGYGDTSGSPMAEIVPGGLANAVWRGWLDQVAAFAHDVAAPIIFRPFHENTGSWFWWGANHCTPAEFVAGWQYTVDYLRDVKGVHNFLYAYSPSGGNLSGGYGARYPGDAYVDICGFDFYGLDSAWPASFLAAAQTSVAFAEAHDKIPAVTEFGARNGLPNSANTNWYTALFLNPLKDDPVARRAAYALTWRNDPSSATQWWIPLSNHVYHADFLDFFDDPCTVFGNNLPDLYSALIEPPKIVEHAVSPAGSHVRWTCDYGFAYQLRFSATLDSNDWNDIGTILVPGVGTNVLSVTDTGAVTATRGFYAVDRY